MILERHFRLFATGLIALLVLFQVSSILDETQTWDEGIHLASGYIYLRTGDYQISPEHPPLGRILNALPLLAYPLSFNTPRSVASMSAAGYDFVFRNRLSPALILNTARAVTILLTMLFAAWIATWTRRHFGSIAALIALSLFVFDPNIIAHGRYVTTDLIAAFTIFLAVTLWIDDVLQPTDLRLTLAGLALGCALASKYSALFLIPLVILSGFAMRRFFRVGILVLIAAIFVAIIYSPEFAHTRGGTLEAELKGAGMAGGALKWTAHVLHLPHSSFLIGVDRLVEQNEVGEPGYLLGRISDHGWWYYFPISFLVKTPTATLVAFLTAGVLWRKASGSRAVLASITAVALAFFLICSSSGITIGHRHILPVYAFLFAATGAVLSARPRLAVGLIVLVAIESMAVFPNYLSFFNQPSGGPSNGARYLVDSNLDWGQDLGRLGRYMDDHGLKRVCLAFFGNVDPLRYGVEYLRLPHNAAEANCVVAISATPLHGLYAEHDEYAWLRTLKPSGRIGYSIYLFDLRKQTPARAGLP